MNEISKSKAVELLLVEDNPVDIKLTTRALKKGKLLNHLHVVRDGVEAMDFLHNEGEFADVPRPDLILLDLNMPRKDGREVLSDIKNDDELKYIPVIVLTTSDAEQDVLKSYNLHANSLCVPQKAKIFFPNLLRVVSKSACFALHNIHHLQHILVLLYFVLSGPLIHHIHIQNNHYILEYTRL